MSFYRNAFNLAILSVVFSLCLTTAWGQVSASLRGDVKDNQGGLIPGAEVELVRADTGVGRKVVTAEDGEYQFQQVAPSLALFNPSTFGEYRDTTPPRVMQFALRYEF